MRELLNKITCGDCRLLIKQIPDRSVDLIIADFPYVTTGQKWDKIDIVSDALVSDLRRVLKPTGSIYVWCGIGEKAQSLIRWFPVFAKHFVFKDLITWKKQRGIGMRKGWLYAREEVMWLVADNKQFTWDKAHQYSSETYNELWAKRLGKSAFPYKRASNVWSDIKEETLSDACGIKGAEKKRFDHFTPKPLAAIKRLILPHTKEGDIVLDPSIGSGTTAVACVQTKRQFIGFESSPEFCGLSNRRMAGLSSGVFDATPDLSR